MLSLTYTIFLDNYGNPESDTPYYDYDAVDDADQGNCYWFLYYQGLNLYNSTF